MLPLQATILIKLRKCLSEPKLISFSKVNSESEVSWKISKTQGSLINEVLSDIFVFGRILACQEKTRWGRCVKSQEERVENIPKALLSSKGVHFLCICSLSSTVKCAAAGGVLSISWALYHLGGALPSI